jgi:hypothetical protein
VPAFVIKTPSVVVGGAAGGVGGTDISDHIREIEVDMTAADVDITASGAGGHQRLQGIRDDKFTLTALSDFAANKIDATIYPLFAGASLFVVSVWAAGTVSLSTNPCYSGTCILTEYKPISGKIGDASETPLTLPVNGVISRATS